VIILHTVCQNELSALISVISILYDHFHYVLVSCAVLFRNTACKENEQMLHIEFLPKWFGLDRFVGLGWTKRGNWSRGYVPV